jgi:16S rRNA (uracil1498-N3)-methyltransferase
MPATPAWPPKSTPRLFIDQPLEDGQLLRLDGNAAHYLGAVMRSKPGDPVKLFDDRTGEWLALVESVGKRDVMLTISEHLRPRETVADLWLLAAPIKKARLDMVVEKACELGIAHYQPVITRRTIIERMNMERLRSTMIEAAEQCGRTALPRMEEAVKLPALLKSFPEDRTLFFADEDGGASLLTAIAAHPGPAAILTGPEGGFDNEERALLRAHPRVVPVSLGPLVLRAETAAICAISVWMAQLAA